MQSLLRAMRSWVHTCPRRCVSTFWTRPSRSSTAFLHRVRNESCTLLQPAAACRTLNRGFAAQAAKVELEPELPEVAVTGTDLAGEEEEENWQDVANRNRAGETAQDTKPADLDWSKRTGRSRAKGPSARLYEDDQHAIRGVDIPRSAWTILLRLRAAGHESYIVGGAVRDLLLGGVPKDFDILTSATVVQVRRYLSNCRIVGKRFPIVQVQVGPSTLEVSSFATNVALSDLPFDAAALLASKKAQLGNTSSNQGRSLLWSVARQQNAMSRDFTVNALMFDPFARVIYDYTGGLKDCRQRLLRTIQDPEASFRQDPARILRAVRLAARAELKPDAGTAAAIEKCKDLILTLHSGRIAMEVQALMGYGSAAESMRMFWRFKLMDLLFPMHAAYLEAKGYPRNPRKPREELYFDLLASMDSHGSPTTPIPTPCWVAIIAAPLMAATAEGVWQDTPAPIKEAGGNGAAGGEGSDDASRISGGSEGTHDAADAAGVEDATDGEAASESDSGTEKPDHDPAYAQMADEVLEAMTERLEGPVGADLTIIPKLARGQALRLLLAEERSRRLHSEVVKLRCGVCGREKEVTSFKKAAKCSHCHSLLPTKQLRKRQNPNVRLVEEVLQQPEFHFASLVKLPPVD